MRKQLKPTLHTGEKTPYSSKSNGIQTVAEVAEESSSQNAYVDKLPASKLEAPGYNLSSPSQIIQLQRTIGNRRVGQILQRAVVTAESLIKDFEAKKAIAGLVRSLKGSPKPAELVHELAQTPDGKAFLKAIVMQTDTSRLGQLAMQEVFGIKEIRGFDNSALKLMWPAFEKLPAKHLNSMDNTSLQGLITYISEGDSRLNPMNSINHGDYQKRSRKARIGYSTTLVGTTLGGYEKLPGVKFLGNTRTAGMSTVERANAFSHTVLHEIGHAIDHKLQIMTDHGSHISFGGWYNYGNKFPSDEVVKASLKDGVTLDFALTKTVTATKYKNKKPYQEKVELDSDELELYYKCLAHLALGGSVKSFVKAQVKAGKIQKNQAARYKAFFRTDTSRKIKKIRDKGFNLSPGWALPYSELESMAIDGRVYHRAYPGSGDGVEQDNWVSYNLKARKEAEISAYQWRAPGEWFAEVYAAYFEDALSDSHPIYGWFKHFIDNNDNLNPVAIKNPTEWKQEKEEQARLESLIPLPPVPASAGSGSEEVDTAPPDSSVPILEPIEPGKSST